MQIDKATVINFLKNLGRDDDANRAQSEMPDQLDTDRDAGLLGRFGLDPSMLSELGGGGAGGLLGKAKDVFDR